MRWLEGITDSMDVSLSELRELVKIGRASCRERVKAEEKRVTEDEMAGWHHQFNAHELGQTPGDGEVQGSLSCCSPWGCRESDMTERLN